MRGGFLVSILVGFVGAYIGVRIARMMHLPEIAVVTVGGHPFPIVWSIAGGLLFVVIAHMLTRGRGPIRY